MQIVLVLKLIMDDLQGEWQQFFSFSLTSLHCIDYFFVDETDYFTLFSQHKFARFLATAPTLSGFFNLAPWILLFLVCNYYAEFRR